MSVTVESVGPGSAAATTTGSNTKSWTHTTSSGSNQALYAMVVVGMSPVDTTHATVGVTLDGVAMKSIGKVKSNNQEWGWVEIFRALAPSAAAHTLIATASVSVHSLICASINLNGVDQTTPNGPIALSNFGTGASSSTAALLSKSTGLVVAGIAGGSGITGPGTGGTNRSSANVDTAGGAGNGMLATFTGASTVTPSFTETSDWWGIVAFHVNATADVVAYPVIRNTAPFFFAGYVSGFATSGAVGTVGYINVPDKAVLTVHVLSGATAMTALTISDVGGHTWTSLLSYNPSTMGCATAYWYNNTGGAVDVGIQATPTYSSNVGFGAYADIVTGTDGVPNLLGTLTGATTTPQKTGTPTIIGSLIELFYAQRVVTGDSLGADHRRRFPAVGLDDGPVPARGGLVLHGLEPAGLDGAQQLQPGCHGGVDRRSQEGSSR
jgi:hypothetical protein